MFKFIVLFVIIFFSFKSFSIDVDETIESTVQNNPKVKIGLEKLIESKEFIESAYGGKLPTITSTITGTYSNAESQTTTSTTTPETFTDKYKLSITQNLFDAGYNDLEIDRSKILFDNEVINFKIIIQDLILDAITGYLTVINYEKSLEATEKNFESVSKALEITKTKFDLGSSTLYDLQKAESFSAIASANLFAAEQNVEISKKSFQTIAGLEPVNLEDVIDIESSITLSSVLKTAMNNNLILKLLINDTKNKEILLLKEKKTKQPNIDIVGSAEYSDGGRIDDGTETTKGSVALTLTIPIYQQGIKNSNIRKYQSQILQAELNFEDYKEDLKILISNAYKDFKISEAKMNSNSAVIQASQTALESLKQEYDFGTKTITDLIEEEGNLLLSSVDYLDSKKNYLINYFKIKSLEGTLLNTFENYLPVIN
ncbi:MAG: TolC family protein [Alphaproteobacteria bacterium]|jgi:outer membrane protein|nr:TolC family protein [Alphaproteobacteria bacterium]